MKYLKIDKLFLPVKIHYFLFMTAMACASPFRTVFAKQLGLSATAVGVIFLAVPFFQILTNPLFGVFVDYFKKFRLTISVLMLFVAITHVAMVFIPPLETTENLKEPSQNVQSIVEFVCPFQDNKPHIIMYNKFETEYDSSSSQVTCDITCQTGSWQISESTEKYRNCDKNISGAFTVNFKISNYSLKFSLANESYVTLQNDKKKLGIISKEELKLRYFSQKVDCFQKRNYFIKNIQNLEREERNDLNQTNNLKLSWNSYQKLNFTFSTEVNNTEQIYIFIVQNLYMIEEFDNYSDCFCEQRLNCTTTRCNYIIDEEDIIPTNENEFLSSQFWLLFFLIAISSTFYCTILFLIDTVIYEMLSDRKEDYGVQRLWGTIGWGLGALAGGYLNQLLSPDSTNIDYSFSFYLLGVLILIDLISVYKLQIGDVKYSSNICKDVCSLLSKTDIAVNIVMIYTVGVLTGLIWNYQFWFMEEIGASQFLLGLSQTFECLAAEVPCFFISGWVVRKIGYVNCNSLTFLCFGLRYLGFAFMWDPWMSLPVGFLHGPTFGIFHASMTTFGKTEAPPGTEATVQSLLAMAFEGVGAATGSILGGIGFDKFGSRKTFLISATASFILLVVNILLHIFVLRPRTEKPSEKSSPEEITTKF